MKMVSNNGRSNRSLNNLSPPYTTTPVYPDNQPKLCSRLCQRNEPPKVLLEKSGFFRDSLKGRDQGVVVQSVEISDCDDVEVYLETLVLMYSHDLKRNDGRGRLQGLGFPQGILKFCLFLFSFFPQDLVSADIMFETGIVSCLECLEAMPWSEDEEEKVVTQLGHLQLCDLAAEVLQRVSSEPSTSTRANDIFLRLLSGVMQAKDDKARREMRTLISRFFRENSSDHGNSLICLSSLTLCLSEVTGIDDCRVDRGVLMAQVAQEAENMRWIVDILIDRKIGDEFVKLWADQKELALLHSRIPTMYRHEISKITAQLCIAIGRGHILVPKDCRFSLLSTWLEALYEDFAWMTRSCRSVDKKLVEDGLSQTILTLPLLQQQTILLTWFDRFLSKGDDCPNIQKAFEVWWRRAFIRQHAAEPDNSHLQITVCDHPN
ncbi:BTB/POZ domain-containing protein [Salix suchowensis]|nr:BTB/POZ domain-containing protein [Salix suchowensis]